MFQLTPQHDFFVGIDSDVAFTMEVTQGMLHSQFHQYL